MEPTNKDAFQESLEKLMADSYLGGHIYYEISKFEGVDFLFTSVIYEDLTGDIMIKMNFLSNGEKFTHADESAIVYAFPENYDKALEIGKTLKEILVKNLLDNSEEEYSKKEKKLLKEAKNAILQ